MWVHLRGYWWSFSRAVRVRLTRKFGNNCWGRLFLDTSPAAGSFLGNALSSLSLLSRFTARWPTSSTLKTCIICITVWSSRCLSSSNSAGDSANSPWCTCNMEQQLVKEKMVRAEELISPASRVSLVDKPSVRGWLVSKELSWSGGESDRSWGMTSPRNCFSSQRKEVWEARNEPDTCLRKSVKDCYWATLWQLSGNI